MRKFISIIFISLFCFNVALAAITRTDSATDECEAGYYVSTAGCMACDNGTYTDTANSESCSNCNKPKNATFTTPGTSINGCSWEITCDAGTHYVSDDTNSGCRSPAADTTYFFPNKRDITGRGWGVTEGGDYKCSTNSTPNSDYTGCICDDGYHLPNMENNDIDTTAHNVNLATVLNKDNEVECIPNDYTITYNPNNNKDSKKTRNVKFNQAIDLSEQIKELYNPIPTKEGHSLSGWTYNEDTYPADAQFRYLYTNDITLTAQWEQNPFTVTYIDNECTTLSSSVECSSKNPMGCRAASPDCIPGGYLFRHWQCTEGCLDPNQTILKDGDILDISTGNDITLTAVWEQCPDGYYCDNIEIGSKCPAGSTSDAGSSTKADCYIQGGSTKICDKADQCFILPDSAGKIYYHGDDDNSI